MAECKLVYINYRGRAELIRFILAQAEVKYDDSRIELEKWAELRPGNIIATCKIMLYIANSYMPAGHSTLQSSPCCFRIFRNSVWNPAIYGG